MFVEQIWTANAYRNFNYLVACPETGDALAIDPLDHARCLATAKDRCWRITQILNTHEHGDHTGGNQTMVAATGAKLLAHRLAMGTIPNVDRGLAADDRIRVGKTVELQCLDTPGHTLSHICLLSKTDTPALFSGDTLFNAGAGNCHNGGHPEQLFNTFAEQLAKLPGTTLVYPGHDYMVNNLEFTLNREPNNQAAMELLEQLRGQNPNEAYISTLEVERRINSFFRLQNPSVIAKLKEAFTDLPEHPDPKTVFLRLRELRNRW